MPRDDGYSWHTEVELFISSFVIALLQTMSEVDYVEENSTWGPTKRQCEWSPLLGDESGATVITRSKQTAGESGVRQSSAVFSHIYV